MDYMVYWVPFTVIPLIKTQYCLIHHQKIQLVWHNCKPNKTWEAVIVNWAKAIKALIWSRFCSFKQKSLIVETRQSISKLSLLKTMKVFTKNWIKNDGLDTYLWFLWGTVSPQWCRCASGASQWLASWWPRRNAGVSGATQAQWARTWRTHGCPRKVSSPLWDQLLLQWCRPALSGWAWWWWTSGWFWGRMTRRRDPQWLGLERQNGEAVRDVLSWYRWMLALLLAEN